jgi:hypothetical protein
MSLSLLENEAVACPKCGRRMLLATAEIIVHLRQIEPTIVGLTYGDLTDWPILVSRDAPVVCNHTNCMWEGTVADLFGDQ